MAGNPIGLVTALLSTDKLPGTYLQTRFGVGGNPANQIRNILVVAAPAIGGGTLTPDTEVLDIVADGDEVTYYGNEGCEGARMVRMMRKVPGIGKIKAATATISGGAAASATITIDGTWTTASTGPIEYWIGGQPIAVSVLKTDTPEDVADAIAAAINAKSTMCCTASVAAGSGTSYVVTLVDKSYTTRGNSHIVYQDDTYKPSGLTTTLGGAVGGSVSSDAGPWNLNHGDTLVVAFNAGGNQTFTLSAVAAAVESGNAETFALSNGMTLTVKVDGEAVAQSISFLTAEFVSIGSATAEEVAAVINAKIVGATATVTSGGTKVTITSDTKGTGSHIQVTGGTANTPLAFSTSVVDGTGNVADVDAVTAAEWVTIMSAITNGTAENVGGALKLTSATTGASGTAQVVASSTADDEMGFDNAVHAGNAGGATLASGGVRFTGGAGTEDLTNLLDTLTQSGEAYWTIAFAQIDATNLGRIEEWVDAQAGPLVRNFSNVVSAATGTLAAATSLAQTTLDNVRFSFVNMEEGETPGEEMAAYIAAVRHIREQSNPNQNYDFMPCPFVPQRAASKRPSRATKVTALDAGVTIVDTKNNATNIPRMITTRSLTATGGADDGTIDVGQARTPDVVNELLGAKWTQHTDSEDPTAHHVIRNDPAPGEEADVPAGITFPKLWRDEAMREMKRIEGLGWIVDVDLNPVSVAMHPTSSTPHFVMYAPVVVAPLAHQLEGTIAQTKFTPA